jgi:hypothetical protein
VSLIIIGGGSGGQIREVGLSGAVVDPSPIA